MTKIDQKIERLQEILRSPVISKTKTEYEDTLMLLSWLNELKEYREEYARSLGYEYEGGDKIEIDYDNGDNGIDDDFDEEEFDDDWDDILEEIEKEKAQQSIINSIFFNQPISIEGIRYLKCMEDPELEEELMDLIFTIKDLKDITKKTK